MHTAYMLRRVRRKGERARFGKSLFHFKSLLANGEWPRGQELPTARGFGQV